MVMLYYLVSEANTGRALACPSCCSHGVLDCFVWESHWFQIVQSLSVKFWNISIETIGFRVTSWTVNGGVSWVVKTETSSTIYRIGSEKCASCLKNTKREVIALNPTFSHHIGSSVSLSCIHLNQSLNNILGIPSHCFWVFKLSARNFSIKLLFILASEREGSCKKRV